jgi:copper chaperone CopZ
MESGVIERVSVTSSRITSDKDSQRLESTIGGIDGIRDVTVDPEQHTVEVAFDPTTIDRNAIKRAVEDAGYRVDSETSQVVT